MTFFPSAFPPTRQPERMNSAPRYSTLSTRNLKVTREPSLTSSANRKCSGRKPTMTSWFSIRFMGGDARKGGTKEVYDDPAATFVATFLCSPPMNLISNQDVIVGFRPEHLRLAGEVQDGHPRT